MRRAIVVSAAVILCATWVLAGATAAGARGGGWTYDPAQPFDRFICGANMHFSFPVDRAYGRIATLRGDTVFQETGSFVDTITNTDNDRSITVNNSAPIFFDFDTQSVSVVGTAVILLQPSDAARNHLPEMVQVSGHWRETFDAAGVVVQISGTYRDLCAELT